MMAGSSAIPLSVQQKRAFRPARCVPDHLIREVLEQAVTRVFSVRGSDLWSFNRGRTTAAFARQVAMYLAHVEYGLTLTEVGNVFGRDRTTVAHACGLVEDRREDPRFDHALELLQSVLRFHSLPASLLSPAD